MHSKKASGLFSLGTITMDAEIKAKWLAALRSGEYQQAQGCLRIDDTFCCLGVLCDVAGSDNAAAGGKWTPDGCYRYNGEAEETVPPDGLLWRAGLPHSEVMTLFGMNDSGFSFAEIADYIEEHL